jgi:hypothetical protein
MSIVLADFLCELEVIVFNCRSKVMKILAALLNSRQIEFQLLPPDKFSEVANAGQTPLSAIAGNLTALAL